MASLRTRLLVGITVSMTVLLVFFSLVLYQVIRHRWIRQFDESLLSTARLLALSAEVDSNGLEFELHVESVPEFNNSSLPMLYQISEGETVVAQSPLLAPRVLTPLQGSFEEPVYRRPQNRQSPREHVVGFQFQPLVDPEYQVQLAADGRVPTALDLVVVKDATDLYRQMRTLAVALSGMTVAVLALTLIASSWVVRTGLRPLTRVAAAIGGLGVEDLSRRIEEGQAPEELQPVTIQLNALLDRLQQAFAREQRFTADVAHELRTPLAGLRTTLDVTLTCPRNAQTYSETLTECQSMVIGLQSMVDKLMALARLDAARIQFQSQRVPIREWVQTCWQAHAEMADARNLSWHAEVPATLCVTSDPDHLTMVLTNLLSNAVTYTDIGGEITLKVSPINGGLRIAVSNTGCRLDAEAVAHVFDRFWRGDPARTETGLHCGLGLALTQRIVQALGGDICAHIDGEGLFTIEITLPSFNPLRTCSEINCELSAQI